MKHVQDHPGFLAGVGQSGGLRGPPPDWMPDAGIRHFVEDLLEEFFNIDVCRLDEKWIPLVIVSTLDWLRVAMWWFFEYSEIERTNENYERMFNFDGLYEFDPEKLLVFRLNPGRNAFDERWNMPGLTDEERQDIVGFVNKYFKAFGEKSLPPQMITERIAWATFIWVLSDYGRDWIYMLDVPQGDEEEEEDEVEEGKGMGLFACVQKYTSAFLSAWESGGRLLDPRLMYDTGREIGTCAICTTRQWCVQGYMVKSNQGPDLISYSEAIRSGISPEELENLGWSFYCNRCAVDLNHAGYDMDEYDSRLSNPMCGNTACLNTGCPHLPTVEGIGGRQIPRVLVERGRDRVGKFHDHMDQIGGITPRQLSGQSADDIVNHFRK